MRSPCGMGDAAVAILGKYILSQIFTIYWEPLSLESPLDCQETKPLNTKENQSRIFIGSTDAEGEALILGPPVIKN